MPSGQVYTGCPMANMVEFTRHRMLVGKYSISDSKLRMTRACKFEHTHQRFVSTLVRNLET